MSIYALYQKFFVAPFCLSIQEPFKLNLHCLLHLRNIRVTFSLLTRKKNKSLLLRSAFLLLITFASSLQIRSHKQNQFSFMVSYTKQQLFYFYEKFIVLIYPHLARKPIYGNFGVNDWYYFNVRDFNSPENFVFELHLYEKIFHGNFGFNFFFSPPKKLDCFLQKNYLRMLNLPLQFKNNF